jgi:formylmethanofuran dehydrogenase subunit E
MELPPYFDDVPRLRVQDPLARALGCAKDGVLEYCFSDAVRVTGHACPTVASAYWLTYLALEQLYPDALPQRGGIKVEFRDDARSGNSGVMATVVQMLTGAAGSSGFKGLGGRFARAGLIRYRPDLLLLLRFTRMDTRAAVDVSVDVTLVPAAPGLEGLVAKVSSGKATADEEAELGKLWHARMRRLLLDCARDPAVFVVRPVERRATASTTYLAIT